MNIVLGIISIIFVYTSTILMDKFLKKEGLIIWITFATITANILVCKKTYEVCRALNILNL